jgi:hypothetical protein
MFPGFYRLLSNMIELIEKQLFLIVYYTYGLKKILKLSILFYS